MPVIKLTDSDDHAREGSTKKYTWGFNFTPVTLFWTWSDLDGNAINSREDEEVESPSTSETITLSGDDLGITAAEKAATSESFVVRAFTVYGTYLDGGESKTFREEARCPVDILTVDHDGN